MGEWVNRSSPPPRIQKGNLFEVANDSWTTSSRDLQEGVDMREDEEPIPGDLFDDLFGSNPASKTATGE